MNIVKKAGCILINMKEKKIALVLRMVITLSQKDI